MFKHNFFVRQRDMRQCGAASLSMVCAILGKRFSLNYIETFCIPTTEGVSIKTLKDSASVLGLKSRAGRLDIENLKKIILPAILFWDNNHYVVLYGIDQKGRFLIADPMSYKLKMTEKELRNHWITDESKTGIAVIFEKTEAFAEKKNEGIDHASIKRFIYKYSRPYLKYFATFLIGLMIAGSIQMIFPFLTQIIVDRGIPQKNLSLIWLILIGELIVVLGKTVSDFIRRWLLVKITNKIGLIMNGDFIIKYLSLPMDFYEKKTVGDIFQRITDFSRVQTFLISRLLGSVYSFLLVIGLMAVMYVYSKIIFIIILCCIILFAGWTAKFLNKRKEMDFLFFKTNSRANDITMQLIGSPQEIKIHGCHEFQLLKWERSKCDVMDIQMQNLCIAQKLDGGRVFITEVRNLVVNVLAATQVIDGTVTMGGMFAMMFIVGQLSAPIEQLVSFIVDFQDLRLSLERISEIHELDNEEDVFGKDKISDINKKNIVFNNVSFNYMQGNHKAAIDGVSFIIPSGKITAIVGSSGSGKTTLIKLLLGYYKCTCGEILIDGVNINELDIDNWRNHIGVVLQNGKIFNDTIVKNISLCDDINDVDWKKIEIASKVACLNEVIEKKINGWNTVVGKEGEGLSQGQKQRILIARAIYRDPKILIMDEATNSLDSETEKMITNNLSEFYRGRTVIIIAHRLSTVVNADNIIVLDNGCISEQGNHKDLIRKNGAYYHLVKTQLDLGI